MKTLPQALRLAALRLCCTTLICAIIICSIRIILDKSLQSLHYWIQDLGATVYLSLVKQFLISLRHKTRSENIGLAARSCKSWSCQRHILLRATWAVSLRGCLLPPYPHIIHNAPIFSFQRRTIITTQNSRGTPTNWQCLLMLSLSRSILAFPGKYKKALGVPLMKSMLRGTSLRTPNWLSLHCCHWHVRKRGRQ